MKTKLALAVLLIAVVCMCFMSTSTMAGPLGMILVNDDGDIGGGPAEFTPMFLMAEDASDGEPAE